MKEILLMLTLLYSTLSCRTQEKEVIVGAEQTNEYFLILKNKWVAISPNHTGVTGNKHLLDVLLKNKFSVVTILFPERGFRGDANADEHVPSTTDSKTGVPILSLYDEKSKKSNKSSIRKFDILIIDIQDVGLRFYTYYISMAHLMDTCSEYNRKVLTLDRSNPNGHYVDGPILDVKYKLGVGGLPIPIIYGTTLGELALVVNGESWLSSSWTYDVIVIPCKNYIRWTMYRLSISSSPNLPNMKAVYLYPSTCFFEATPVSLGRGASLPFQVYGHPNMIGCNYSFTPRSAPGAESLSQLNKLYRGVNLSNLSDEDTWKKGVDLTYIVDACRNLNMEDHSLRPFFELLIGTDYIRKMIEGSENADEIRARWKGDVGRFKVQRKPHPLYPDNWLTPSRKYYIH